ncbi:MAG: DUF1330 domain-containing protein [Pseudomonadales bacterium]|jgi:uncharacterized protein (DUF1330 family)|nr:DUF1330 domain-containing protein [Pseudomonadales bacterium]
MADVPAYVVANLVVTDAQEYRKYEKGFFPILKKYQGEFITYDDNSECLEGSDPLPGRVILFKFPSAEIARQWYADEEYQALSEFRRAGTELKSLTLVNGLPPRS